MNSPRISIIVPVYNVEKYLSECIESILLQTYSDFELLLIDDGSPDQSGAICDEYAARDQRIRVFHKENGGVSSARNLGIDNAKGEWITFVDSDDRLEVNTLMSCSTFFKDYDIIRFSMRLVLNQEGTSVNDIKISENDTKEEYISEVVSRNAILGICGGIYKKSIFNDNNIRFSPNLINGEDWFVLLQCLLHCNALKILNKPLYLYNRFVETSCTNVFRFDVHYSALLALDEIKKLMEAQQDKANESNYNKELIKAKCILVYDYIATRIKFKHTVDIDRNSKYKRLANMTFFEIQNARMPFKCKLLLSLYWLGIVK